ncbi:hypothetical protein [Paenibacillus sp. L3-i20]|uniref:hypothetical protein n=1 Tax=Paenibacillus sp. L3-i20 TaxID=2905833 RepID=UPI001EDF12C7|nr:hypothetical protein [Paenibacillus sp. L3-i20]GKU79298.1 hypothetical protein L3i20_v236950 [Paenibacillus sp. L3-i20]
MDWLKKLQERYRAGKITKDVYDAKVAEGLEDEVINQEEHDAALKFDPKAPEGGELIYSQEDVDRIVVTKSRTLLRKELKAAGIELDVDNKGLMAHVVNLVKGEKGKEGVVTEVELATLRKDASKAKALGDQLKNLTLENAVLRNVGGQYTPVNPNQVVRALRDYADEIEYDEYDVPEKRSVELVLRKLAKAEPNLFKSPEDDDNDNNGVDDDKNGANSGRLSGKTPGGGASGGKPANKSKEDAALAAMLSSVGIKSEGP